MGLLERLRRLIASNVNALFDSLTDPGSAIDELIRNMEAASREARAQVASVLAEDIRAARLRDTTEKSALEWEARAARAVKAGDDGLAQEALAQRDRLRGELVELDAERDKAKAHRTELERGLRDLDAKIAAVKSRKETLKAVMRARAAGGGAAERYDRIVTDVDVKEAEVKLGEELGDAETNEAGQSVRARIEKLESDREVDSRLAALKDKMKK